MAQMAWPTPSLVQTLLKQGLRNVRYGGLPFFFATLMTALGLFALGAFSTILLNFERVAESVGRSIGAVAFLDVDSASDAEAVRAEIGFLDGVAGATLVTPEAALQKVQGELGEAGSLLSGAAGVRMPWVVEVSVELSGVATTDAGRDALVEAIGAIEGIDEVQHPGGDLARIEALGRVLLGAGVFLSLLVGLVTIVVVSNTVKLTLFARRDEIAIMKLVGATDSFVRVPFLLEGLVQGIIGAAVALVALVALHQSLAGVLRLALSGALGPFELHPLPWQGALWMVAGGAGLGLFGAGLSLGRFLRV